MHAQPRPARKHKSTQEQGEARRGAATAEMRQHIRHEQELQTLWRRTDDRGGRIIEGEVNATRI